MASEPNDSGVDSGASPAGGGLACVFSGGGARAAYQAGVLRYLARRFPDLEIPILTGVSAGAVNAAMLAQHHGTFAQAVDELVALWADLEPERIFHVSAPMVAGNALRWGTRFLSAGRFEARVRGVLDTSPLRRFLHESMAMVDGRVAGIDFNLERGTLRAVALSTTSYTTGQSVIWVQGRGIDTWRRPSRRAVRTRLTVDHVMASAALPILFPAVRIGDHWYGDGGIRLTAPLSPALHLGADRIIVVSTRHPPSEEEADRANIAGYPPPAQIMGVLYNAVFLDLIDQDVVRLERINRLLRRLPREQRDGMRIVELMVIRPSRDLGLLARECEPQLPRPLRIFGRVLGSRETRSQDLFSMLMFQRDYAGRLMDLGEADAAGRADEISSFLSLSEEPGHEATRRERALQAL